MEEKLSVGISENRPVVTPKKLLLVVATLFIVLSALLVLHRVVLNTINRFNKTTSASGETFQILSEPREEATLGENYTYIVRVGRFDSEQVYVTVTSSPKWLRWDSDKLKLSGTPTEEYIGQNYVVIKATDTNVTKEQAFSIFVEEAEENVQGAQDEVTRVNDEEPVATTLCQQYYNELGPLGLLNEHPECKGIFSNNEDKVEDEDVLGVTDNVNDFVDNFGVGAPTLSAAPVGGSSLIFGGNLSPALEVGIIASSAVVILGISILIIWITFTSMKVRKSKKSNTETIEENERPTNFGNLKEGRQQSFVDKKNPSQVIIWD